MSIALGDLDFDLVPHDHICAFYRGLEERDGVLIPYLREGLDGGDRCICIVDSTSPDSVIASVRSFPGDGGPLKVRQLEVLSSSETYLRDDRFAASGMLDFWGQALSAESRVDRLWRVVGEMTWALRDVDGVEELITYERQLNGFLSQHNVVCVCLYDFDLFDQGDIVGILAAHPKILASGMLIENPYFSSEELGWRREC